MKRQNDIEQFYHFFPEPEMARDLINILEDFRIESRLKKEYPVLGDHIRRVNQLFAVKRPSLDDLAGDKQRIVEIIGRCLISGKTDDTLPERFKKSLEFALRITRTLEETDADIHRAAEITTELYFFIDDAFMDAYRPVAPFSTLIDPSKMENYSTEIGGAAPNTGKKSTEKNRENPLPSAGDENAGKDFEFKATADPDRLSENRNLKEDRTIYDLSGMPEIDSSTPDPRSPPDEGQKRSRRISFGDEGLKPDNAASIPDRFDPGFLNGSRSFQVVSSHSEQGELTAVPGEFLYPEWGTDIGCYRINWARVKEHAVKGDSDAFYRATFLKYAGLIKKVKQEFRMMRPEGLVKLKRQLEGEEIDLDSTVEYFIDRRLGMTPSEKNYVRIKKDNRDIAVSFLVDISGSTRGSTIALEKEALIIMAEALRELGDVFSIYGFSGNTREHVEFYVIKDFFEVYDYRIAQRISSLQDRRSTRIGPAVRHAAAKLAQRDEKIKMLILLSDGKPEDKAYEGAYGIEDTRMALKEGQQKGIRPFCITVDDTAPEYLHRMYSHSNWVVINDVTKLPLKITRIYKRLTT